MIEEIKVGGRLYQSRTVNNVPRQWFCGFVRVDEETWAILTALAASQAETLELRRRLDASATGMATLNDRIAELEGAYTAACGYIDVSVCDPDITAEMWQAWQKFKETRAALGRMLKEGE